MLRFNGYVFCSIQVSVLFVHMCKRIGTGQEYLSIPSRSGSCGLPSYCAPLVRNSNVIGGSLVWWNNKTKPKNYPTNRSHFLNQKYHSLLYPYPPLPIPLSVPTPRIPSVKCVRTPLTTKKCFSVTSVTLFVIWYGLPPPTPHHPHHHPSWDLEMSLCSPPHSSSHATLRHFHHPYPILDPDSDSDWTQPSRFLLRYFLRDQSLRD